MRGKSKDLKKICFTCIVQRINQVLIEKLCGFNYLHIVVCFGELAIG